MKKIVFIFLIFSASLSFGQDKETFNIGVIIDTPVPEALPLLDALQEEISKVVGEDAIINFPIELRLINEYKVEKAQANYDKLLNADCDMILAFGPVVNNLLFEQKSYPKPTILFGTVNRDLSDMELRNKTSGIENFTYIIDSGSFMTDIGKFNEITGFKSLGIAIDEPYSLILPIKETFDREFEKLEASYKLIPFNTVEDIAANLEEVDALYIAGGYFISDEDIEKLAQLCINKKIPTFTANGPDDVKLGIMSSNQSDDNFDRFSRRIAITINDFIGGSKLSDRPVFLEYSSELTINFNTAEAVDVPIRSSLIKDTNFVGEFYNAKSQETYNLLKVINDAISANLSLQSDFKDVELAEQDLRTANSDYLPTLTAIGSGIYVDPDLAAVSFGQSPEFSTTGTIALEQTVFSESANANISIQKSLQKAQKENFNASQLDLILDVANTYFQILILKANTQIQLQNLNLTKTNLEVAEQNFEAGQAGKSDMLRFKSEMAQNTQSLVEAANELEQGFIGLNLLLNQPLNQEIDIDDVELNKGLLEIYNYDELIGLLDEPRLRETLINFLVEEALNNSPELKSFAYNLSAAERNINLSGYGRFLPTVSLEGNYNSTFNRSGEGSSAPEGFALVDNNYTASLNLTLPIFSRNSNNINQQIATLEKEQLEIDKNNFKLLLDSNVRNGILSLLNQVSNIDLSTISEEAAQESLELTQTSYSKGAVNIVQLIDAQSNYLTARLSRVNAIYNFLIAALSLERSLGYFFLLNSEEDNQLFRQRFFEYLNFNDK
ncbi:MAG: TolC family protein [Bacteroidota bacterium]